MLDATDGVHGQAGLLRELERNGAGAPAAPPGPQEQLPLFDSPEHPVMESLRSVDVHRLTPIQALLLLDELCEQARS